MLVSEAEPLFLAIPISVFSFCAKSVNVDGAELFAFLKLDLWLGRKKKRMITVTAARANRYVNKQRTIAASLVYGVSSSVVRRLFLIYLLFFFSLLQCISALFSSIMMLVHIYFRDFFSTLFFSVLEYAFFPLFEGCSIYCVSWLSSSTVT